MRNIVFIGCLLILSQTSLAQDSRFYADDLPIKSFQKEFHPLQGRRMPQVIRCACKRKPINVGLEFNP